MRLARGFLHLFMLIAGSLFPLAANAQLGDLENRCDEDGLTAQECPVAEVRVDPDGNHLARRAPGDGRCQLSSCACATHLVERAERVDHAALAAGLCAQLNVMERVWRYLTQKLACRSFWADIAGLERTTAA